MKTWWQQLNQREQKLVMTMAFFIVIFFCYLLVWQPITENIKLTQKKLQSQQSLLAWVQKNTHDYQQATRSVNSNDNRSLSSIVNRTATRNKLNITRIQPQGDDLQVWIDQVEFTQLLIWLEQLANQEGLYVNLIDLSQTEQKGVVQVKRLQLGKG